MLKIRTISILIIIAQDGTTGSGGKLVLISGDNPVGPPCSIGGHSYSSSKSHALTVSLLCMTRPKNERIKFELFRIGVLEVAAK